MAFGLSIKIGADISGLHKGLNDASKSVSSFGSSVGPAIAQVAKMAAAAAAAATAIGSVLVKQSFSGIDALGKLSDRVGGTTEGLQGLRHAADLAGMSKEGLTKAADMLNRRLGEATRGYGEGKVALDLLGMSARELSNMDVDERFAAISDRLKELGYNTQQTADVMGQLGIRNKEVINLMMEGGDAIRKGREEIDAFGGSLSRVDAKQVEEANDAMTRIWTVVRGIADRVAVRLAPIIQHIAERFTDAAKETKGWQSAIDTAFNVAITGAGYVANAIHGIRLAFSTAIAVAQTVRFAFTEAFRQVVDAFVVVNDAILKGVNATIRALNSIPGVDISEIALAGESEFVARIRQASVDAQDAMSSAWDAVADKWSEPLPGEGFKQFLADINEASRQAAEEAVNAREGMFDVDDEGAAEVDTKYREQLAQRLEALRQSNLGETEAEQEKHARNLELLNESFANELLTHEEWHDRLEQENEAHLERMKAIRERNMTDLEKFTNMSYGRQVATVSKHLADMTAGVATSNKKMFELNKVAGIANAIVSAYEGISLTMSKYPYPINIGMAAAHAAAAFAQVSAIKGSSFGGGGAAPSLAGGTAATPVTPVTGGTPQQERRMFVEGIDRSRLYSGEQIFGIIDEMNRAYEDGYTMVFAR